ncbi:STAS domain-containing protein [Blastococcus sp. SYSU DS0539]
MALPSAPPTDPHCDDVSRLLARLDLVTGRLELVGRLGHATAHLLHDAISALLLTPCTQWTLDLSRVTVGDHHGVRAIAVSYRRATRHHRQLTLRGASPTLQRAVLQLGCSAHHPGAGAVIPN